jgi:large subunit ribosomal protein L7Ae
VEVKRGQEQLNPRVVLARTHTLDRNTATPAVKLFNHCKPERLLKEATAVAEGQQKEDASKKPYLLESGLNHVVALIENKKAELVLIANDVDPIEL